MSDRAHLDLAEWRAFFEQSTSAVDRDAMLDHISSCPQCAQVFKAARTAGLAAVGAQQPRREPNRIRILVPIAAMLSIVIVSAIVVSRNNPPPAEPAIQSPASPATATAPAPVQATLVKPPVVIGAELLLANRGTGDNAKYLEALADALRPYESDDFKTAIARLQPLATAHPDRFEPVFYLGASLMMAGRSTDAIPVLERALTIAGAARREQAEATLAAARSAARP